MLILFELVSFPYKLVSRNSSPCIYFHASNDMCNLVTNYGNGAENDIHISSGEVQKCEKKIKSTKKKTAKIKYVKITKLQNY